MPKEKYEQFSLFDNIENTQSETPQEKNSDKFTYKVYAPDGRLMLRATKECRYSREIEKQMLENGFTIKLNGKSITKKGV